MLFPKKMQYLFDERKRINIKLIKCSNTSFVWFFFTFFLLLTYINISFALDTFKAQPDLVRPWSFKAQQAIPYRAPYGVRYKKDKKELIFLGANHENKIYSETFQLINKIIKEFKPELLIIEGFENKENSQIYIFEYAKNCAERDFVDCGGEPAYAAFLAQQNNIAVMGGEPTDQIIWDNCKKKNMSIEDFMGFYLLRQIPQWKREGNQKKSYEKFANEFLSKNLKKLNLVSDFNLTKFHDWYKEKTGLTLDIDSLTADETAPSNENYIKNISYEIDMIRDRHLAILISDNLNKYHKILVIYGHSHYSQQKPVLENLFNTMNPELIKLTKYKELSMILNFL